MQNTLHTFKGVFFKTDAYAAVSRPCDSEFSPTFNSQWQDRYWSHPETCPLQTQSQYSDVKWMDKRSKSLTIMYVNKQSLHVDKLENIVLSIAGTKLTRIFSHCFVDKTWLIQEIFPGNISFTLTLTSDDLSYNVTLSRRQTLVAMVKCVLRTVKWQRLMYTTASKEMRKLHVS